MHERHSKSPAPSTAAATLVRRDASDLVTRGRSSHHAPEESGSHASDNAKGEAQAASQHATDGGQPSALKMDVSHGRSARMSFDTAREMAKTLTPAQEIAHIENELRALGYTKTHQPVKEALTMKNPQYNPSTKTLEELRLQRRTATGVLPKSMEEHNIEKEVQEDGKVYRNARACTGGDMKMRYPGPHDRPKRDDIIPHYETPTKQKHVKGSGRRAATNNDDAEYWSDDGGSWQRSNKDSPGARRVGKSSGSPESISKSSLKKFQWRRKRREWSAERGDERGDNWRGSDAHGNDPDFSGGKYRRGGEYAKDIVGF